MVDLLSSKDRMEWNSFAGKEPVCALLQSWEWGEIKEQLGWKAYRYAVRDESSIVAGAQVLVKSLPIGPLSAAYIPRGPIGNWSEPARFTQLIQAIHQMARREHVVMLKIEPPWVEDKSVLSVLEQNGFQEVQFLNQPKATITLDLSQDFDTIFSQMRKSARRKIKDGSRKGLTARLGSEEDLRIFYEFLETTAQRAGFSVHPYKYYQKEFLTLDSDGHCLLLFAIYENTPIAVNLTYHFGGHAAFFHQASAGNTGNLNPNYFLVWEAIKLLKEKGCRSYDLWGIPDEIGDILEQKGELPGYSRTDGLWGVYKFKAGFGKNVVVFPGAYDYVYQPLPYSVISPVLSREETLEPLLKWASLNRFVNEIPGISFSLRELSHIRSLRDVTTLFGEAAYHIRNRSKLLNSRRKHPLSLQLEPTNFCNADCAMCPGKRSTRSRGYMDWSLFRKIVDDASKLGVKRVYLDLHGEPTLHEQIAEMIGYIKNKGLTVRMTTNGIQIDSTMMKEILKAKLTRADYITFSILGDATYTHNCLMENSNLDSIRENIFSFMDARAQLGMNGPVVETIFRRMDENRFEEVGYRDSWADFVDHARLGGQVSQSFSNYKIASPAITRETRCETVQERMTIYWDGAVTICHHDLDGDYLVGDLNDQSIEEIWNNEQLSTLRKLHREGHYADFEFCARCDF